MKRKALASTGYKYFNEHCHGFSAKPKHVGKLTLWCLGMTELVRAL